MKIHLICRSIRFVQDSSDGRALALVPATRSARELIPWRGHLLISRLYFDFFPLCVCVFAQLMCISTSLFFFLIFRFSMQIIFKNVRITFETGFDSKSAFLEIFCNQNRKKKRNASVYLSYPMKKIYILLNGKLNFRK